MALPATTTFTALSTGALSSVSANWSDLTTNHLTVDNTLGVTYGPVGEAGAYWNADVFSNDQYSKAIATNDTYPAPCVRASNPGASANCYIAFWNNASVLLQKLVSGSRSSLGSWSATFTAGAALEIQVSGTLITVKYNGVTLASVTDSDLSSGSAGIYFVQSGGSAARITSWEGGNFGAAAAGLPFFLQRGVDGRPFGVSVLWDRRPSSDICVERESGERHPATGVS